MVFDGVAVFCVVLADWRLWVGWFGCGWFCDFLWFACCGVGVLFWV